MNVFLAGASGAIGLPLLRALNEAGHNVTALTRSADKISLLRDAGARTVAVGDALDEQAAAAHLIAAEPDVVINQLTAIPADVDPKGYREAFEPTNRLRTQGSLILTNAAARAGARRYITQSIAFAYEATDLTTPVAESQPLVSEPPEMMRDALAAIRTNEDRAFKSENGPQPFDGVVLRYGFFLGRGSAYRPGGGLEKMLRRRQYAIVGGGRARLPMVHIDDAAAATVAALSAPAAAGRVFNVCCDDAPTAKEFTRMWAKEVSAPRPLPAPRWLARRVAGEAAVWMATKVQPASNAAARAALDWAPRDNTVARALRHMIDDYRRGDAATA